MQEQSYHPDSQPAPVAVLPARLPLRLLRYFELHLLGDTTTSHGTRFPALDGLRALAVLSVLFAHMFGIAGLKYQLPNWSNAGVATFFVLSAFLLYYPYAAGKPVAAGAYYWRRAWRILPAFVPVILIGFALEYHLGPAGRTPDLGMLVRELTFTRNLFGKPFITTAGPLWSLGTEAQFYLVLPILALLACRRLWSLLAVALALTLISARLPFRIFSPLWINWPIAAIPFFLGMASALLVVRIRTAKWPGYLGALGLALVLIIPLLSFWKICPPPTPAPASLAQAFLGQRGFFIPLGSALMIFWLCCTNDWLARLLSSRPLPAIRIAGYGVFLLHFPILLLLIDLFGRPAAWFMPPLALLAGAASYIFIESPAMHYASRCLTARRAKASPQTS
jgi:peptidoglycan/LPS O-acetylase OafA/YrhL